MEKRKDKTIVNPLDVERMAQRIAKRMKSERDQREFNERIDSGQSSLRRKRTML